MNVPAWTIPVRSVFQPAFSTPTYHRFLVLVLAAVLTTGRRTISHLVRTVRSKAPGHVSSDHRVFSRRRWSAWALARALITFLLGHVVPPGPVLLAGDDTVTEHPGPQVFGKGRHRDGVRSSHKLYGLSLGASVGGGVGAREVADRDTVLGPSGLGGPVPPPGVGSRARDAA